MRRPAVVNQRRAPWSAKQLTAVFRERYTPHAELGSRLTLLGFSDITHMKRAIAVGVFTLAVIVGFAPSFAAQNLTAGSRRSRYAALADRLQNDRDNAELQKVPPFKILDNVYYVGVGQVGACYGGRLAVGGRHESDELRTIGQKQLEEEKRQ